MVCVSSKGDDDAIVFLRRQPLTSGVVFHAFACTQDSDREARLFEWTDDATVVRELERGLGRTRWRDRAAA